MKNVYFPKFNVCCIQWLSDEVDVLDLTILGVQANGPILMDGVQCIGDENHLHECDYKREHMCSHNDDIGIICHCEYTIFIFSPYYNLSLQLLVSVR